MYKDPEGRIIQFLAAAAFVLAADFLLDANYSYAPDTNWSAGNAPQSTSPLGQVVYRGSYDSQPGAAKFAFMAVAGSMSPSGKAKAIENSVSSLTTSNVIKNGVVHGNSLTSPKLNYGYQLVDTKTGQLLKFGITGNSIPFNRYSKPQYRLMGADMEILNNGSRIDMRTWETMQIKNYELLYGTKPPLNKNYR